jgi:hypothetical protein
VSNSSRGLLAAGLTAAVVGSMGIVWTLNANADETPEMEIPAAQAAAAAEEPVLVPPALLPWGERPRKLKRGKAGASSAAIAAAGADAAPPDTSGSMVRKPEFAPKGRTSRNGVLRSMRTTAVPPTPPKSAKADDRIVYFSYAGGNQIAETDGTSANLIIAKPELAVGDDHSLAELVVESADSKQMVEVGWTVDPVVNRDPEHPELRNVDPHLFVYLWVDGKAGGYNDKDKFVQHSDNVAPGYTLPEGDQKKFGIQHAGGAWWIAYGSEYIGYFPDSLWGGRFTKVGFTQWFGEIARGVPEATCTDMGNGVTPVPDPDPKHDSARIGSLLHINGPTLKVEYGTEINTHPKFYPSLPASQRTFRYGGPGTGECPKD